MILQSIKDYILKRPTEYEAYKDMVDVIEHHLRIRVEVDKHVEYGRWLNEQLAYIIPRLDNEVASFYNLHERLCKVMAIDDFDSYILFMEWHRDPDKSFYIPRRKQLKVVVDSLQDLYNDKLDLLCISMPPGAGKTTIALFYLTWLGGKHPEDPILTGSHSGAFVDGGYKEILNMLDGNGEYRWKEVFPHVDIVSTNAKALRIDLGKRKRFDTFEFTSIGSGNAGLHRAKQLLYCDDLVSGLEVALSKERLDKLWEVYTTDLRQRKIGKCKELHIATRWSVHDVIGRLELEYGSDERSRFIVMPAMNEKDESNFDYPFEVGFSTEFYKEQREIMDELNWRALYMNEPIEREGILYPEDQLRYYFELPDSEPDAVIAICDTKDRGTDYAVLPVAYVYGDDYYIEEVICDNGLPEVLDVRMVDILVRNKTQMARFESNSAGGRTAKEVQRGVKAKGGITNITTKYTTANKETKIIVNSGWVKERCLFRDNSTYVRSSEYARFMNFLTSYTQMGRNKYDDVPDAMAMLAEFATSLMSNKVEILSRPW